MPITATIRYNFTRTSTRSFHYFDSSHHIAFIQILLYSCDKHNAKCRTHSTGSQLSRMFNQCIIRLPDLSQDNRILKEYFDRIFHLPKIKRKTSVLGITVQLPQMAAKQFLKKRTSNINALQLHTSTLYINALIISDL